MKKKQPRKRISNRRAHFDYELSDNFLVGVALTGRETKSLRMGHGQLQGAYVTIKNGELWLVNAAIHGTRGIPIEEDETNRTRKLLAKKREIATLASAKQQGRSVIPTDIFTEGRFIKVRIAIGRGKKVYDKRQTLKRRDDNRSVQRELKRSI